MNLSDFDYDLPEERIAQTPAEPRDSSRLLILNRESGYIDHRIFRDLPEYLRPGDVLVLNQTRVIPARLYATKAETGGKVEILLLKQRDDNQWEALVGGKNVLPGVQLNLQHGAETITATVIEELDGPRRVLEFSETVYPYLDQFGEMPLPPYITDYHGDPERYQTVFARQQGSSAAPTAGLHFTGEMLFDLQRNGIKIAYVTLHIGLDTFAPVRVEHIEEHKIHRERAVLTADDAKIINEAKLNGGRIIAVGTTSARTIETAAIRSAAFGTEDNDMSSVMATYRNLPTNMCPWRPVIAIDEETDLFITPGYQWRGVDTLLTNFHLPKSTLLMMVSSFAGHETVLQAYQTAIGEGYRFFSFGDAMLIV
ncbi:MAG: tRNA preQ1(34) S-adenosylmethionine ribosyltransferase-isomerase QueA [Chloroflexi bacterium]|nr:tRNA preQ1(34) S-adenosylmethionine ribosyltransferase-isomerase QueA [Chloroflexota bacterium]